MTLACGDGQQMQAHKVILAASSPFFERILKRNKNPHPLIYLRGFQWQDLLAILDFIYFGEANVYQENFDSFLATAEEIKLKGLAGQTSSQVVEKQEKCANPKPTKIEETLKTSLTYSTDVQSIHDAEEASKVMAIPNQFSAVQCSGDLEALDEKVKSMMEKSQNMVQYGKRADGTPKQEKALICKVCGKEGRFHVIRCHIETNHLGRIYLPCDYCDKASFSRDHLRRHQNMYHK